MANNSLFNLTLNTLSFLRRLNWRGRVRVGIIAVVVICLAAWLVGSVKDAVRVGRSRAADARSGADRARGTGRGHLARDERERYEKTRRHDPADAPPVISDDELCAELSKRSIPCR